MASNKGVNQGTRPNPCPAGAAHDGQVRTQQHLPARRHDRQDIAAGVVAGGKDLHLGVVVGDRRRFGSHCRRVHADGRVHGDEGVVIGPR